MKQGKKTPKDNYSGVQSIEIIFSIPFIHVCKMLRVDPKNVLYHFASSIGKPPVIHLGYIQQEANDYFLTQGYGQQDYTKDQIRQLITEIGLIMGLGPKPGEEGFQAWVKLRDDSLKLWEKKWQAKRKKIP